MVDHLINYMYTKIINLILADPTIKTATKYLSPKLTIRVTRFGKIKRKDARNDFRVQYGRPNYTAAKFIKLCIKAGEPFPIKKVQLKYYSK